MAYAFQEKQDDVLGAQKDEEQQNNTVLTSTAGDLGAETFNAGTSGQSTTQKDAARQPQQTKRELLQRNQGRAQNPFQFEQTRQALGQAKQGVQSERDTYMQNAVTPYQYGQAQQQAVKTYAREGGPAGQAPDWLAKYQQGTPTALPAFQSNVNTNFAPVNALKTDAGVRSFLRNPNDPESRAGEQAIDFSLLNADPTFNINRENTLRDYGDLLNFQDTTSQTTPIDARKAQLDAMAAYKQGITGTLEGELGGIESETQAAEKAYDDALAAYNSPENRNRVLMDAVNRISEGAPQNLRGLLRNPSGMDTSRFFNPMTGEATKAEDFMTEDQAGDFNRIASILGRGGPAPVKGRFAGQSVGDQALGFDENAFRDFMLNQAQRDYENSQQSPFAGASGYEDWGFTEANSRPPASAPAPTPPASTGVPLGSYEALYDQIRRAPGTIRDSLYTGLPPINKIPGTPFSEGGRVPGKAPVPGDHEANDVVSAKLSPGEIVIPRTMAGDKESAKQFIDNMPFSKTRDLLKTKYNCGGKVSGYNCGGKVPGYAEGGRVNAIEYTGGFDTPIPGVQEAKKKFDDYLTENVVNPMAQAGYEDLGAALATIPSVGAELALPSAVGDLAMPIAKFNRTKGIFEKLKTDMMDNRFKFPFAKQKSQMHDFNKYDLNYEPKYLFHSTRTNPKSIMEQGLVPNVGKVSTAHYDFDDMPPLEPLIFFSDNPKRAEYFATKEPRWGLSGKRFFENENDNRIANQIHDLKHGGVLTVTESKNVNSLARKNPNTDEIEAVKDKYLQDYNDNLAYNNLLPYRHVEDPDFVSDENVMPDYVIWGNDLLDYAQRDNPQFEFIRKILEKRKK